MSCFRKTFAIWFAVLMAFFVFANLAGTVRPIGLLPFRMTGFPFTVAAWGVGISEFIDWYALAVNLGLAVFMSSGIALMCAWARSEKLRRNGMEGSEGGKGETPPDPQSQIEESRRRFARSLVGCWSTAQGTFNGVMGQHWEVRPGGTGRFTDTGPFGNPSSETRFEWRQSEEFVFELRLIERIAHQPEYAYELDEEDWEWREIRYDFLAVPTDCGVEIGLVATAKNGSNFGGFFDSTAPLAYCGPVGEEGPAEPMTKVDLPGL